MAKSRRQSNEVIDSRLAELEANIPYQIKTLAANSTSNGVALSDLTFNNLEVGKSYRISLQAWMYTVGTPAGDCRIEVTHNSQILAAVRYSMGGASTQDEGSTCSTSVIFTATTSTLTFVVFNSGSSRVSGNGTVSQTFAMLEEYSNRIQTSQWT